jgi:hypothetical protein
MYAKLLTDTFSSIDEGMFSPSFKSRVYFLWSWVWVLLLDGFSSSGSTMGGTSPSPIYSCFLPLLIGNGRLSIAAFINRSYCQAYPTAPNNKMCRVAPCSCVMPSTRPWWGSGLDQSVQVELKHVNLGMSILINPRPFCLVARSGSLSTCVSPSTFIQPGSLRYTRPRQIVPPLTFNLAPPIFWYRVRHGASPASRPILHEELGFPTTKSPATGGNTEILQVGTKVKAISVQKSEKVLYLLYSSKDVSLAELYRMQASRTRATTHFISAIKIREEANSLRRTVT